MSDHPLRRFFAESATKLSENPALADTGHDIVQMMSTLVDAADPYLRPKHYRSDPDHYARNLVYDDEETDISSTGSYGSQINGCRFAITVLGAGSKSSRTGWKNKVACGSVRTRVLISMTTSSLSAGASCCRRRGRSRLLYQTRLCRGSAALCEPPPLRPSDEPVYSYDFKPERENSLT